MRLLFAEATRSPELAAHYSSGQIGILRFMVAYLTHQADLGRLRPHDPEAAARAFLEAMFGYVLSRDILPYFSEGQPEWGRYIDEVVTTFVRGLEAGEQRDRGRP